MKVAGVAWQGFAVPFRKPYVTSIAVAKVRYGMLLFLRTDNGVTGVGEASPVGAGSVRELQQIAVLLEDAASDLVRRDPLAGDAAPVLSPSPVAAVASFGIEAALLDIRAKIKGCSMAKLLQDDPARRDFSHPARPELRSMTPHPTLSEPVLAEGIRTVPVNALITAERAEDAVAEAVEAVALGFTSLKLKVGMGAIDGDEALVAAVRRAVGPDIRLRIDPNQAWSVSQAIQAIGRLARFDLEYVEQPVAARDFAGLREVRRAVPVPIAADEALGSLEDMRRLLADDAADVFVVKAGRLGGLLCAAETMRLAAGAGKSVVVTSSLESGVGLAASVHLVATLPSHAFAHGLATGLLLEDDLLTRSLAPQEGKLALPQGPGLGVEVDMEALERYRIGISGRLGA